MEERMTPDVKGRPGYEGYLNDSVVSIQEILGDAGYKTYMSGKWYVNLLPSDPT